MYTGVTIQNSIERIPEPNQIDFGEGFNLYVAQAIRDGTWSWKIEEPPYITMLQGTTYHYILAPFGGNIAAGRSISFGSLVISSGLLFLILKRRTGKILPSVTAAILPLSIPIVRDWSLVARPDMLGVMFTLAGIYIADRKGKLALLSVIPFLLAFHTKQSFIIAPLIMGISRDRKLLIPAIAVATGTSFLVGNALTEGEFTEHMFTYNGTYPMWTSIIAYVKYIDEVLLAGIGLWVIAVGFGAKNRNHLTWYALVTMALVPFMLARKGSYVHYSLEAIFAASIVVGLFLNSNWQGKKASVVVAGLLVVQLATFNISGSLKMPNGQYTKDTAAVKEIIADASTPILTEHAWLVVSSEKDPYLEPFIHNNMQLQGKWESKLLSALQNREIEYLVLHFPMTSPPRSERGYGHFSREEMAAAEANYELIFRSKNEYWIHNFTVYRRIQ